MVRSYFGLFFFSEPLPRSSGFVPDTDFDSIVLSRLISVTFNSRRVEVRERPMGLIALPWITPRIGG
jgi:hypothetical protein